MKKEKLKILTALGTGAVIGGIAGVLFAPRKGSETREKIKESFIDLKVKLQGVDKKDVKKYIEKKLDDLDIEIAKLDTETEYKKAKKQAKKVIKKIDKLIKYTKRKGMDEFEDLIEDLKDKAAEISEEILTNLDD
jgi:gas vesicle protein